MIVYAANNILLGAHDTANRRVPLLHAPRGADFCGHRDNVAFLPGASVLDLIDSGLESELWRPSIRINSHVFLITPLL